LHQRRNVIDRHFYVRNVHNEEAVLHAIEEDSSTSIRQISRTLKMTKSTVHRILKENQLHAYHYTKMQHLMPQDYAQKRNFCEWMLQQEERQPEIMRTVMFTDECLFTREGLFNIYNYHVWSHVKLLILTST
jgi:IS30 family transposase